MIICKENTLALKGLCILIIVAHHYAQNFGFLPDFLRGFGAIGCAVFFFISGYGLTKGPGDFKKWKNRFFRLYLPFFIANSLYLLYFIFWEKRSFGLLSGTKYLIGIPMTNIHWFIQVLLILYFAGFVTDTIFKSSNYWFCCLSILLGGAYSCATLTPGSISWIAFPLGILCAKYSFENVNKCFSVIVFIILSLMTFYIYHYIGDGYLNNMLLLLNFLLMCISVPFVFLYIGDMISNSRVLKMIGKFSIDIYFAHFIAIFFLCDFSLDGFSLLFFFTLLVIIATAVFLNLKNIISALLFPVK